MSEEITGRLENWHRQQIDEEYFIIWGNLYEDSHGRWPEGTNIHTSAIEERDVKEGDIVQTRNSIYKLGKPLRGIYE